MLKRLTPTIAFIFLVLQLQGQPASRQEDSIKVQLPSSYLDKISSKANQLEQKLDTKTDKALKGLMKQEAKMKKKLFKTDSLKAKEIFGNVSEKYNDLQSKAAEQAKHLSNFSKVYSSKLDSLGTAFKFLEKNKLVSPELQNKMQEGLSSINSLQGKLDQTDQIRKFLKERKKLLTEQLEKFGLVKELKQFNKQVYYYQQQIKSYRELLDDPSKLEEKLLGLLTKIPAFRDFFANNSQLGSLFNLPGSLNNSTAALAGLQTRASVMQDLQGRFGAGSSVQQMLQQNLQSAQSQLNEMKNKVNQYWPQGGGSSDEEIPDFKPNQQKTKPFWQRLEYGTNFQSQRPNSYFPVTSDLGLSVGYKLNDKSIIGVGASYKLGWGQNIRNIRLSSQGAGLRSFADVKLKGSFWISGGYEMNYQSEFNRMAALSNMNAWQQSGLLGVSKVVSLNSKFFKRTKVQLMWDFLSYEQLPRTQPVVFRIGYGIK